MAAHNQLPEKWERLGESIVAKTRIFDLQSVRYRHPGRQTERDFFVIQAPDWVNVVALTTDRHLVLVNQFRYGIDSFSLEVPGGVIDSGEDPLEAATRELQEETGYVGNSARLLGSIRPNPAILSNRCHLVFVDQCRRVSDLSWDTDEEIEVLTAPVDEVYAWAQSGRIQHALVLNALLLFLPTWNQLKES